MRKRVAAAILILSCLAFYAWDEEQSVNLAGSWILDQAKSDPFPRSQRAVNDSGVGDVSRGGGGMRGGGGGMRGGGGGGGGMDAGMGGGSRSGRSAGELGGGPVPLVIEQNGNEIIIEPAVNSLESDVRVGWRRQHDHRTMNETGQELRALGIQIQGDL